MPDEIPAWIGGMGAPGLLSVTVLLVLTGRLVWHKWVERQLAALEKQLADAVEALREAQAVNRIHAEGYRDLTTIVKRLADGQDVMLHLIESLPQAKGDRQ